MVFPTTQEIETVMTGKPIDLIARMPVDLPQVKTACYHLDEARRCMREAVEAEEVRRPAR